MLSKFPRVYVCFIIKNTILIKHVQMSSRVHLPGKPSRTSTLRGDLYHISTGPVLQFCICAAECQSLICSSLPVPDSDILQGRQESSMTFPQQVASL